MKGYCVRCEKKREIENPNLVKAQKGKRLAGTCSECGTKISRIVPKDFSLDEPNLTDKEKKKLKKLDMKKEGIKSKGKAREKKKKFNKDKDIRKNKLKAVNDRWYKLWKVLGGGFILVLLVGIVGFGYLINEGMLKSEVFLNNTIVNKFDPVTNNTYNNEFNNKVNNKYNFSIIVDEGNIAEDVVDELEERGYVNSS